jgi:transposase
MTITTVGIDLAKNVFAVHCIDQNGKAVLVKPKVSRAALSELIAGLPPCVIGMEACSGAHYWARLFRQYGHDVRLMAPKFVSPYRMAGKTGKNDAADAIAICEAVAAAYALCTSQRRKPAGNAMLTSDKTGLSRKEQQRITVFGA